MSTKLKDTKTLAAVDEIAPNTKQPREHFDEAALERLARSVARKQRAPVVVSPFRDARRPKIKWMIVDGERRWRAAKLAGLQALWITIDDPMAPEGEEMHEASLVANFCREGHTHAEKANAVQKLIDAGRQVGEIAEMLGKSASWVSSEAGLLRLQPELLKLLDAPTPKEKRMPVAVGYALSAIAPEKQAAIWKKHCDKPTASAIHGVRLSVGEVTRNPSKDGEFLLGKLRNAYGQLFQLCDMPRAMMRNVSVEKRDAAWPLIEKIKTILIQAGERLSTEIGGTAP